MESVLFEPLNLNQEMLINRTPFAAAPNDKSQLYPMGIHVVHAQWTLVNQDTLINRTLFAAAPKRHVCVLYKS